MERLLTLYSEVQSTDVRWLWYPFIAIGKITLLQGDPGDGKSTMMMNLIAELSTGGKTPDGCKIGVPQKVIYQCSEDGVSDTIKPRLERCGADCRKIAFINEEFYNGLTLDDERIRQAIIEFRPRLVVIDPIQAFITGMPTIENTTIPASTSILAVEITLVFSSLVLVSIKNRKIDSSINSDTNGMQNAAILKM